jgi:hypothetical protein
MDKVIMYVDGARGTLYREWYPTHVTNWDGSSKTRISYYRVGRHNWTGKRYDMWWMGEDGHVWHGVHMGDMNTVVHARKTKRTEL